MINTNELRIGNWVAAKAIMSGGREGHPVSIMVETIGTRGINKWQDMGASGETLFSDLIGIQLNTEILQKYGFEKFDNTPFYKIQLPLNIAELSINPNNGVVWLKKIDGRINPIGGKFLHQLQNLYFALTGEELQYNP